MTDNLVGKPLPRVTLDGTTGKMTLPDDLQGKWSVLYFYPRDNTPGCIKEACAYRDYLHEFQDLGALVIGISTDGVQSHESFKQKFKLNFPLLSDPGGVFARQLGAISGEGRSASRDTVLVDPQGKIRRVWRKVDPATTANDTFEAIVDERRADAHP